MSIGIVYVFHRGKHFFIKISAKNLNKKNCLLNGIIEDEVVGRVGMGSVAKVGLKNCALRIEWREKKPLDI
jgi:hypothetical protein